MKVELEEMPEKGLYPRLKYNIIDADIKSIGNHLGYLTLETMEHAGGKKGSIWYVTECRSTRTGDFTSVVQAWSEDWYELLEYVKPKLQKEFKIR